MSAGARPGLLRVSLGLLPLQLVLRAAEASLPIFFSAWFGRSRATDAFTLLWALFGLAGALVFSAFQDSALAPVLIGIAARDARAAQRFVGAVLGRTLAYGGALALLCGLAGLAVARVVTGDAWPSLVVPFAALLVATGARTLFAGVLNAEERYRAAPLATALGSLVAIAAVAALHDAIGTAAAPVGLLAGELLAAAVLWSAAGAPSPNLDRPLELGTLARLVGAEIGGNVVARLNPVADQIVAATFLAGGGATLLRYAGDLALAPTSLLQAALLSVLLSRLSRSAVAGDRVAVAATVRRTLAVVVPLLAAAALVVGLVRAPLCALAFAHGAMDGAAVAQMADVVPAFLVGVPGFGALLVLARAHVALQNSRILPRVGLVSAATNLALDLALVGPLGLFGIALATSITSTVVAAVFAVALRRRLREAP